MKLDQEKTTPVVDRRYELLELLGRGGMGSVFRARDLLSGNIVALKRVSVPADEWLPDSDGSKEQYLTLAQEYQALATLRHPHIISVYDFGFDQSRRPYFTMEYIEGGCDIVEYGEALPLNSKINLLVQMLQALVYLHRRGIIHRDLKPANAVVIDGKVRVLDFGVSVTTQQTVEHITHSTAGTMAYLAPEIFKNEPYSRASDLYAFGVIAFQLLTGAFPYTTFSLAVLLHDILEKQVDTTRYGLRPEIADVLNRLLAKERQKRYDDAQIVIQDLCRASELPTPPESIELRESFLQAAKFVGRKEEMAQLSS
ncbi:MAG: serine/threonine-protein kinase, partial [Candidatus Promineifilaceae bacterium]